MLVKQVSQIDSAFLSDGNGFKRNTSSTCAVASISSISGVTSTNIRSFSVHAYSIHVTRVITFTLVNIWKTIDTLLFCPVSLFIKSLFASWDFFLTLNVYLIQLCHYQHYLQASVHSSLFSYKVRWLNKSCNDDSAFLSDENGYKRNASNTCAVASISSISGVTSTNVQSFGVRADSIHVTRVISFTLVNIWKTIDTFLHLIVFITYSRLIPLIITNYKTNVSLLGLHELDIAKLCFSTNSLIYQSECSETSQG